MKDIIPTTIFIIPSFPGLTGESSRSCKKTDQLDFLSILRLLDAGSVIPDTIRDRHDGVTNAAQLVSDVVGLLDGWEQQTLPAKVLLHALILPIEPL